MQWIVSEWHMTEEILGESNLVGRIASHLSSWNHITQMHVILHGAVDSFYLNPKLMTTPTNIYRLT